MIAAFFLALERNYNCDMEALQNIEAPFNNELLPPSVVLKERVSTWWIQLTKLVDVYDVAGTHLGYFYDMNFLWFMRFGFSDASDRIWFEARRPWWSGASSLTEWWSRAWVYSSEHYYLQRCDNGGGGLGGTFFIDEDTTRRPWWCQDHCMKILDVAHQESDAPPIPVARVRFNYTLQWYYGGFQTRKAWNMAMAEPHTKKPIAQAHQHFDLQNMAFGAQKYVSRWLVDVLVETPNLPNWVVVFMAVLDDIDEGGNSEESRHR